MKYFERFDADPNIQKEEAGNDLSNFRKLTLGRIDAVISTETQADYLIATQGLKEKIKKTKYKYSASAASQLNFRVDTFQNDQYAELPWIDNPNF